MYLSETTALIFNPNSKRIEKNGPPTSVVAADRRLPGGYLSRIYS